MVHISQFLCLLPGYEILLWVQSNCLLNTPDLIMPDRHIKNIPLIMWRSTMESLILTWEWASKSSAGCFEWILDVRFGWRLNTPAHMGRGGNGPSGVILTCAWLNHTHPGRHLHIMMHTVCFAYENVLKDACITSLRTNIIINLVSSRDRIHVYCLDEINEDWMT